MMILLEKIKWMTCVFRWVSNKMADYAVIHKKGKIHSMSHSVVLQNV